MVASFDIEIHRPDEERDDRRRLVRPVEVLPEHLEVHVREHVGDPEEWERDPKEGDRSIERPHDRPEDRSDAGDVEQLDHRVPFLAHRRVVDAVLGSVGGHRPLLLDAERLLDVTTVYQIPDQK